MGRWCRHALGRLPLVTMVGSAFGFAWACCEVLQRSVTEPVDATDTWPILVATVGFLVGAAAIVLQHVGRLAARVDCPQERMLGVLRSIRSGDLTPRVHLRRGDLLQELAHELNRTIEWLNENPPSGAVTGGDVLDVDHHDEIEFDEPAWMRMDESAHG